MEIIELLPTLHVVRLDFGQAYLWRDGDELTLIDTGIPGNGTTLADATREVGLGPDAIKRIVITHGHEDHAGSAAEVRSWHGARIFAHHADVPFITGSEPRPDPPLTEWERPFWEQVQSLGLPPTPPTTVDVELAGGEELDFGDGARIVSIPGHTPGSIAIHLPNHGVLFTGDTVASLDGGVLIPGAFNLDRAALLDSIRLLTELNPDTVCLGHGEPIAGGADLAMRAIDLS